MNSGVLHIRSTTGLYGAEQVLINLARVAGKTNCHINFFIIEGTNHEAKGLRETLKAQACRVGYSVSSSRFDFNVIKKIRANVKSNIGLVHTHDYKSLVLASIALAFTGIKVVHHIHGALGNTASEKIYARIEKFFMCWASKVITVSHQQKLDIEQASSLKNKVIQIDNGTAIFDQLTPSLADTNSFTVAMVARFTPEKNHKKAIDIIHQLAQKGFSIKLNLLGDGPELENIKQYVNECELESFVNFVGFTREVTRWINSSHLMMLTSTTEGLPMSVLESMSYGTPIICTPVGEIPNILKKSKAGWLASEVNEFSAIIEMLIKDNEKINTAGKNAYNYSRKNLSAENQLNKILGIYEDITGAKYERC